MLSRRRRKCRLESKKLKCYWYFGTLWKSWSYKEEVGNKDLNLKNLTHKICMFLMLKYPKEANLTVISNTLWSLIDEEGEGGLDWNSRSGWKIDEKCILLNSFKHGFKNYKYILFVMSFWYGLHVLKHLEYVAIILVHNTCSLLLLFSFHLLRLYLCNDSFLQISSSFEECDLGFVQVWLEQHADFILFKHFLELVQKHGTFIYFRIITDIV